jgi:hypothetical protein
MPQVQIPATYFTQQVRKDYNRPNTALVREFLQNAVDAGAKNVRFSLTEIDNKWHLIVEDDGCGMTKDVLVKALLTYGGSFKGPNSIGGFGCAKIILIFAHESFKITTCQNGVSTCVVGSQLDYEFQDCSLPVDGTVFDIVFHDDYKLNVAEFRTEIEAFFCKCNPSCNIFLDGVIVNPQFSNWDDCESDDWCNIKCHCDVYSGGYIWVRIKGILMFESYIGENKTQVAIELVKPSTDILTVNRDGFTWQYTQRVGKLVNNIIMEKENFGKAFGLKKQWSGKHHNFEPVVFDKVFADEAFDKSAALAISTSLKEAMEALKSTDPEASRMIIRDRLLDKAREVAGYMGLADKDVNRVLHNVDNMICDYYADFIVYVRGKGFDKIPEHLTPIKMGKGYIRLAKLWKHCIKLVMEACNIRVNYRIGWVIDKDESVYAVSQCSDGVYTFLLNPLLNWMDSSNHMAVFNEMLLIACHEVTHVNHQYHDECFTCAIHKNIHNTLCTVNGGDNSWWKEYKAAKDEIL